MKQNKPKHTPGPWLCGIKKGIDTCNDKCKVFAKNDSFFAIVDGTKNHTENLANARLIAAAPELLEALQLMASDYAAKIPDAEWTANSADVFNTVMRAITKARGE
jgi:hypothetical protein